MACKYIYNTIEYSSKDEFVKNVLIPKKVGGETFYKQILQLNKDLSISKKSLADFNIESKYINNRVLSEKIKNYENMVFQGGKMIDSLLNTLEYSITGNKINFSKSTPKYTKILFPTGNTASKVEGHTTLEEFKKQKEDRIKDLEKENKKLEIEIQEKGFINSELERQVFSDNEYEIKIVKEELERVEREGFDALRPIYNFYENTVTNILKKQYGKDNVKQITDEYGNTWNEITITPKMSETIRLNTPNGKIEYTGDLAIEEKIAEEAYNSKDEKIVKTLIGKFIQSIRNLFRNLFKERDNISRLIRNLNQGRFDLQTNRNSQGVRYSINQTIKPRVEELFNENPELANSVYSKILTNSGLSAENLLSLLLKDNLIEKQCP